MKQRPKVALLTALVAAIGWSQEISVQGVTVAEMWKQEVPGFDKATYTPATQYLGIDATKLGSERLSLHLFGWGRADLSDPSTLDGAKNGGYLNYGYLKYRFDQANAEIKAGRFTANQSTGIEQVDGVSARADLKGGFTISAFGGRPVHYRTVDPTSQVDYNVQRDFIFGTRLGWRSGQSFELGLSYLQDGTKAAKDLDLPSNTDYTRKQLGADLLITPTSTVDLRGRTVFDLASHPAPAPGAGERSKIAEHDYTATVKLGSQFSLAATFAERNFSTYFAGTNLPSLFRQDRNDLFKGWGGSLTWNTPWTVQAVADYRHMHRELYGDVNRVGGELRWANAERKLLLGAAGHYVNAANVRLVDAAAPFRSLSHAEGRVWGIVNRGKLSLSLDGIVQRYRQANPYLNGLKYLREVVGSVGYQATTNIKVAGDLTYGSTPIAKNESRGLLRAEYRFGLGKKGGQ